MKNSVRKLLLLLVLAIASSAPAFAAHISRLSASVEADLRQALQLPIGPATQFVSFHIPGNGIFIVVTTDFSMRPSAETPFGSGTKQRNAPSPDKIRKALKSAILHCRKLVPVNSKSESLFVVLVNRSLFSRPGNNQGSSGTYKAYIPIRKLLSDSNPGTLIVME